MLPEPSTGITTAHSEPQGAMRALTGLPKVSRSRSGMVQAPGETDSLHHVSTTHPKVPGVSCPTHQLLLGCQVLVVIVSTPQGGHQNRVWVQACFAVRKFISLSQQQKPLQPGLGVRPKPSDGPARGLFCRKATHTSNLYQKYDQGRQADCQQPQH